MIDDLKDKQSSQPCTIEFVTLRFASGTAKRDPQHGSSTSSIIGHNVQVDQEIVPTHDLQAGL